MNEILPDTYARELDTSRCAAVHRAALSAQLMHSRSVLGAAAGAVYLRFGAALRFVAVWLERLSARVVVATAADDVVWPALRDYPYRPSPR